MTQAGKSLGYGSINTIKSKVKEYGLVELIGELK
jgi:hypothetical protein